MIDSSKLQSVLQDLRNALLCERCSEGYWIGQLSSSALSTATAAFALACVDAKRHQTVIERAINWLAAHQNADGGWGDTVKSLSNVSTTALAWAAVSVLAPEEHSSVIASAEQWLRQYIANQEAPGGSRGIDPASLVAAIRMRYGADKTFAVPILSMLAMAGKLDNGPTKKRAVSAWRYVAQLPFELAALPHCWLKWLALPVVSYAMPALIAIGLARHLNRPSLNPVARLARRFAKTACLRKLASIQPDSGGFLEAAPLTSFVVMNLSGDAALRKNRDAHAVIEKGVDFLLNTVREDGSWPIDTSLSNWCTSLAVGALAADEAWWVQFADGELDRLHLCEHLLDQQYRQVHPCTQAAPGGWAWTNLSGAVPDADDTAAALIALARLSSQAVKEAPGGNAKDAMREAPGGSRGIAVQKPSAKVQPSPCFRRGLPETHLPETDMQTAVLAGLDWLMNLQNRDGGVPTFCRGWGKLPFDRSGSDLTAHGLQAAAIWQRMLPLPPRCARRVAVFKRRCMNFLIRNQQADGSFLPLWFGNQHAADMHNRVYGTARVVQALLDVCEDGQAGQQMLRHGIAYLLTSQNTDGGWGAASNDSSQSVSGSSSIEETALAVDALAKACMFAREREWLAGGIDDAALESAIDRGCEWLIARCSQIGTQPLEPSPIGLYFAQLWYFEKLYPLIFAAGALSRVASLRR